MDIMKEISIQALSNRRKIVKMVYEAGTGHAGGALSIIDILTCIYYTDVDLEAEKRSKVILSKGHAVPAQYAILHSKGYIKDEALSTFRRINSKLQGHPYTVDIDKVDATTGLLGQGLSIAVGIAIAKKYNGDDSRVYAVSGDGELQEGQIWEALLLAAHYKLDNLIFILDYNKLSSSGDTNKVINLEPLKDKFEAFNLNVLEIDGHDIKEILDILKKAKNYRGKPTIIIANTIKGKGVSYMENNPKWHSSGLTDEEYLVAMSEFDDMERMINDEL